jgi:hypothetical protein
MLQNPFFEKALELASRVTHPTAALTFALVLALVAFYLCFRARNGDCVVSGHWYSSPRRTPAVVTNLFSVSRDLPGQSLNIGLRSSAC